MGRFAPRHQPKTGEIQCRSLRFAQKRQIARKPIDAINLIDSFAQSPAIRARAIYPIYAKTTVALAKAACHHVPRKICE
jgi:hypothetical protein